MNTCTSFRASVVLISTFVATLAHGQTTLFERHGGSAGMGYGSVVASLGDVDADGVNDWAVGAPLDDVAANDAGMVVVYSGATQQVLHTWRGSAANDRFGGAIAGTGDLDGDGFADVLVGASGGGYALVFSGASGLLLHALGNGGSSDFGYAVASGGDVDGDGLPDLLVGEPFASIGAQWTGRVQVFSGASGALLRTHDGSGLMGNFGLSLVFLGDLDGDQRDEYVVGAPARYISGVQPYVRAFDGATGSALWTNTGATGSDEHGIALAAIADLSGDGLRDVLVGASQDIGVGCGGCLGRGYVRALDGATGAQLYQVNNTIGIYVGYGSSIAIVGDVNGNGFEDFAAGGPGTEGCSGPPGIDLQVRDGQDGSLILSIARPTEARAYGASVAFGDTNADGLGDLFCGAPCSAHNGPSSGTVYGFTIVRELTEYCSAKANSQGCTPYIEGQGSASATLIQPFRIRGFQVLNNQFGVLFYGFAPTSVPFQGGSLCVRAPQRRTAIQNSGGNPPPSDCSGIYSFEFNDFIRSGVDPALVAGEQVYAQYWSRDPLSPSATGLTNGLAFYILP